MSTEINELVSYFINEENQTLEVTFRFDSDSEDEIRTDKIDLNETKMPDTKLKNTNASVFLTLGYKFWSDAVSNKEVEKK